MVYKNNKNNIGTVCPKKSHIRFPHNYWVSNSIAACYVAKYSYKMKIKKLCQSQKCKLGEDRTETETS